MLDWFPNMEYMGRMIRNVDELIEEFGGMKPFAAFVGKSVQQVYRAKAEQKIPAVWRMRVFQELQRRNADVDPALLGMERQ